MKNGGRRADLYVSSEGADPSCTEAAPGTIGNARDRIREMNAEMDGDITVYMRGGRYELKETIVLEGANGSGAGDGGTRKAGY